MYNVSSTPAALTVFALSFTLSKSGHKVHMNDSIYFSNSLKNTICWMALQSAPATATVLQFLCRGSFLSVNKQNNSSHSNWPFHFPYNFPFFQIKTPNAKEHTTRCAMILDVHTHTCRLVKYKEVVGMQQTLTCSANKCQWVFWQLVEKDQVITICICVPCPW
jgi:hypothetical protein